MKEGKVLTTKQVALWFAGSQIAEIVKLAKSKGFAPKEESEEALLGKKPNSIAKDFLLELVLQEAKRSECDIDEYIIRHAKMKVKE